MWNGPKRIGRTERRVRPEHATEGMRGEPSSARRAPLSEALTDVDRVGLPRRSGACDWSPGRTQSAVRLLLPCITYSSVRPGLEGRSHHIGCAAASESSSERPIATRGSVRPKRIYNPLITQRAATVPQGTPRCGHCTDRCVAGLRRAWNTTAL